VLSFKRAAIFPNEVRGYPLLGLERRMTTEMHAGKTLVIVTAEFSEAATETLEEKVKSLILRHLSFETGLAKSEKQSDYDS